MHIALAVTPLFAAALMVALIVIIFLGGFQVCYSATDPNINNYISWNDMEVDEGIGFLYTGEQYKQGIRNVIVVDKNGRGQSRTVQGAIDLVPQNNNQRVKIYILPGIYR